MAFCPDPALAGMGNCLQLSPYSKAAAIGFSWHLQATNFCVQKAISRPSTSSAHFLALAPDKQQRPRSIASNLIALSHLPVKPCGVGTRPTTATSSQVTLHDKRVSTL